MAIRIFNSSGFEWPATCCCPGSISIVCCKGNIVICNGRGDVGLLLQDAQEIQILDTEYDAYSPNVKVGCCPSGGAPAIAISLELNEGRDVLIVYDTNTGEKIHSGIATAWSSACCNVFQCRSTEVGPDGTTYPWVVLVDRNGKVVENRSIDGGGITDISCWGVSVFTAGYNYGRGKHVFCDGIYDRSLGPEWNMAWTTNYHYTWTDGNRRDVYSGCKFLKTIYGTSDSLPQLPAVSNPTGEAREIKQYILADGNDTYHYFYDGIPVAEIPNGDGFRISGDTVLFSTKSDADGNISYVAFYKGVKLGEWTQERVLIPAREGTWPTTWPTAALSTAQYIAGVRATLGIRIGGSSGSDVVDTLHVAEVAPSPLISLNAYTRSGDVTGTYYVARAKVKFFYMGELCLAGEQVAFTSPNGSLVSGGWMVREWETVDKMVSGTVTPTESPTGEYRTYTHLYPDDPVDPDPEETKGYSLRANDDYAEWHIYYDDNVVTSFNPLTQKWYPATDVLLVATTGDRFAVGYIGESEVWRGEYAVLPENPACGERVWFRDTLETIIVIDPDFGVMRFNILDMVRYDAL